jgi:phage terminase small subunit
MEKGFNVTRERIAQELARIGFADIRNLFDEKGGLKTPENWSDEDAAAVASVETDELFEGFGRDRAQIGLTKKVKVWEKTKALEALCRLMGYNEPDKKEISGKDGGPIQISGMTIT